jgi:DNA-directed RNA polymerase subunit L
MKIAQPLIDEFLKKLKHAASKSPVTKLAHKIAEIFEDAKKLLEKTLKEFDEFNKILYA